MAESTVRFQPTPNPNAGKFTIAGRTLVEGGGSRTYSDPEAAGEDPVAAALFELDGVRGIFMVADFVTVTKSTEADWRTLAPQVEATLRDRLPT